MKRMAFEMPEMKVTAFMEENIVTNSMVGTNLGTDPGTDYTKGEISYKKFTEAISLVL